MARAKAPWRCPVPEAHRRHQRRPWHTERGTPTRLHKRDSALLPGELTTVNIPMDDEDPTGPVRRLVARVIDRKDRVSYGQMSFLFFLLFDDRRE